MQGIGDDLTKSWEGTKHGIKKFLGDYVVPFGIGAASLGTSGVTAAEKFLGSDSSIIPLHLRTYLSSVGNSFQNGKSLTDEDLFPADLRLLKSLIQEKELSKKSKSSNARKTDNGVVYGYDYETGYNQSKVPGRQIARKTLGRFDYIPNGPTITVQDVYDFAVPKAVESGAIDIGTEIANRILAGDIEGAAAAYGSKILPSNMPSAGRKVNIKIKNK